MLGFGLAAATFAADAPAHAVYRPVAARTLSLTNLHTGEALTATYWENGVYVEEAHKALNRLLRDHRTGDEHHMDPGVLDLLFDVTRAMETREPVQIVSGYRSPASNAYLQENGSGVATNSLHMQGKAIDVAFERVDLARLRDAAVAMQRGGVGYYPGKFVHLDVGRVRRW